MRASPPASSEAVRVRFQHQRRKDTAPELALRKVLWRRGLRYRVDRRPIQDLRRTADVVFPRHKLAVYVDGCFWHGCAIHKAIPKTNSDWWAIKLANTAERDRATDAVLAEAGWKVIRAWEHEDFEVVADRVEYALNSPSGKTQ